MIRPLVRHSVAKATLGECYCPRCHPEVHRSAESNREARRLAKRRGFDVTTGQPLEPSRPAPSEPSPSIRAGSRRKVKREPEPHPEDVRRVNDFAPRPPRATCDRCGGSYDPSPPATTQGVLLAGLLEIALLGEIANLQRRAWPEIQAMASASADEIARSSDLEFGGKQCRSQFVALARGLAALSFAPGGVHFCGVHWCARHPESTAADGQYATRSAA